MFSFGSCTVAVESLLILLYIEVKIYLLTKKKELYQIYCRLVEVLGIVNHHSWHLNGN